MAKRSLVKWTLVSFIIILNIISWIALVYSVLQSKVMAHDADPYALNLAILMVIINIIVLLLTFLIIYMIKTNNDMNKKILTLEKIIMNDGISSRK